MGDKSFPVPPARTVKSRVGSPAVDATILGVGGHLSDYGVALRLKDLTTGEVIWRVEADTTGRGHVTEIPTGRPSPHGGMGAVGGVVRTEQSEWPDYDPRDPAFLYLYRASGKLGGTSRG